MDRIKFKYLSLSSCPSCHPVIFLPSVFLGGLGVLIPLFSIFCTTVSILISCHFCSSSDLKLLLQVGDFVGLQNISLLHLIVAL
jgi:hypothetical protein